MTKDEALTMALESLENSVDLVVEDAYNAEQLYGKYPARQGKIGYLKVLADQHKDAIAAIQEVLAQPVHHPQHTYTLQEMLAQLHLYEEINEHYAECNPGPAALRDWVAERMDKPSPLPVQPAAQAEPCHHSIADARNPVVQSGYVCIKCGALFSAADHEKPAAQAEPEPTRPANSQEWAGMDGATAFHLITRHSDNWADARMMMDEWRLSNPPAAQAKRQPLTDEQRKAIAEAALNGHASSRDAVMWAIQYTERQHDLERAKP